MSTSDGLTEVASRTVAMASYRRICRSHILCEHRAGDGLVLDNEEESAVACSSWVFREKMLLASYFTARQKGGSVR